MRTTILSLLGLLLTAPAWAQDGARDAASAAEEVTDAAEDFDRDPVKCITANRIDRTEIIDARTVVFHMRGNQIYRNRLAIDCPRLVTEKRFSYDLRTNRLCDTDYISVLEYWGTELREGPACGLGLFYPITQEEAAFLNIEPDEMLENAAAVEETVESAGEPVPEGEIAPPDDATIYDTVDSDYREDEWRP